MLRGSCIVFSLTVLLLAAAPAGAAQEASQTSAERNVDAIGPASLEAWLLGTPSASGAQPASTGGASAQAECIAYCDDGSILTCEGDPCSAQNTICSQQQVGYCSGDSGTQRCPGCPCSAQVTCSDGSTVSCTGFGDAFACREIDPCYVECNGMEHWCPDPLPPSCPWWL